jgi:cytochrome c553
MMRFYLLLVILLLIAFACKKNQEELKEKKIFVMAETSEMTKLMIEMYAYNESIKQQIINGELKNSYPERFDNIHSSVLTNPSVRDSNFEAFALKFIEAQKQVFESPQEELTINYNNAIQACITCHNVKCVGPIPRIKKLLIK